MFSSISIGVSNCFYAYTERLKGGHVGVNVESPGLTESPKGRCSVHDVEYGLGSMVAFGEVSAEPLCAGLYELASTSIPCLFYRSTL